ncbi:hypothetical protein CW304_14325 [Bacillus sp. UFRGS-B20]|nr:hypothetical protein CW304_14325 [Bacillus sp. UFRGS-B20]
MRPLISCRVTEKASKKTIHIVFIIFVHLHKIKQVMSILLFMLSTYQNNLFPIKKTIPFKWIVFFISLYCLFHFLYFQ